MGKTGDISSAHFWLFHDSWMTCIVKKSPGHERGADVSEGCLVNSLRFKARDAWDYIIFGGCIKGMKTFDG